MAEATEAFDSMSAANTRASGADQMRSYRARGKQNDVPIVRLDSWNTEWLRETLKTRGALESAYKLANVFILTWLKALVCQQVSSPK